MTAPAEYLAITEAALNHLEVMRMLPEATVVAFRSLLDADKRLEEAEAALREIAEVVPEPAAIARRYFARREGEKGEANG